MRRSVELIRAHLVRLAQILGIMVLVWALAFAVFVVYRWRRALGECARVAAECRATTRQAAIKKAGSTARVLHCVGYSSARALRSPLASRLPWLWGIECPLEILAWLEEDSRPWWHGDARPCLGIPSDARPSVPDAKDAEPSEFYPMAFVERLCHALEESVDDPLSVRLAEA